MENLTKQLIVAIIGGKIAKGEELEDIDNQLDTIIESAIGFTTAIKTKLDEFEISDDYEQLPDEVLEENSPQEIVVITNPILNDVDKLVINAIKAQKEIVTESSEISEEEVAFMKRAMEKSSVTVNNNQSVFRKSKIR